MAAPGDKLAASLKELGSLQKRGRVAIRSAELSRVHRERLLKNGFLQEVMKGWYIPSQPDEPAGDSTAWYTSYWDFCGAYLQERFGTSWCLSPEQSLLLYAGNWSVPAQLMVRAPKARNKITRFPHDTSLLEVRAALPEDGDVAEINGLRVYILPAALIDAGRNFFSQYPTDARTALATIRDASELLRRLLDGGHSTIAGRLVGAFRNMGRDRIATEIREAMRAADYAVREDDPFTDRSPTMAPSPEPSPYVNRLQMMWAAMRSPVIEHFPRPPGLPGEPEAYLRRVEEIYVTDAYHSLSIEGFRVSPALIKKVQAGTWNPDNDDADREQRDALAARGYWLAYRVVRNSIARVLSGENPGTVADDDHGRWYRELFAPSVTAGLIKASDLAGYRNGPVHIRRSMHVPPGPEAVRDMMPAFFHLLTEETDPAARVVLGHFVFEYIHPYMDGNGRIGRFLMNVLLAAGGYPWTVVPLERRDQYTDGLERASVGQDIAPISVFLGNLVRKSMKGKAKARTP